MIYAIFALSLELLVGSTGLVCFGHAAFFGIGALRRGAAVAAKVRRRRCCGCCRRRWRRPRAYALFVGALSLRTRGVYFIMVTLAFAQMAYFVVHDTPLGGGTDGIYLNVKPVLAIGGVTLLDLDRPLTMYYLVLALPGRRVRLLARAAALALRPRAGRHPGQRAAHARDRLFDLSVQAGGVRRSRARSPALGGFLFAVKDGFVNPELLSWHLSGAVLIMIILGGLGPPARRGDRRLRVRAAAGVLQVRGDLRRLRQALAARAGLDHHRSRGAAAARPDR